MPKRKADKAQSQGSESRDAALTQAERDERGVECDPDAHFAKQSAASIADSKDALRTADKVLGRAAKLGAEKLTADTPVKGPASYFPSIEARYKRPIGEWRKLVQDRLPAKHGELVSMLKGEHGMGHGHANAIVAHVLAKET